MNIDDIDCSQFRGRKLDICRGHDDQGRSIVQGYMTEARRKAYLVYWTTGARPELPIKHSVKVRTYSAVPPERWPKWAAVVARMRSATDAGVGDTVQRIAAKVGGERYKAWRKRIGMPCGCSARQEKFNALYPY